MGDYARHDKDDPRAAKGLGFGMTNFPPILCAGLDSNATFYSLILPINILIEIGMTLLVFTFWDVRRVSKLFTLNFKGFFKLIYMSNGWSIYLPNDF